MTSLEYRILQYIAEQCDAVPSRPPMHHHIRNRFAPEGTNHVVNSMWSQGLLARTSYSRKGAHRPFVITQKGREALRPSMVG